MTRRKLRNAILKVSLIYTLFILLGSYIYLLHPSEDNKYFNVFKDLILLWIAVPAAYLGDCFQRRAAFTSALRELWSNMLESVNQARQYTFERSPSQQMYGETLKLLSESIDEIRGVYCNINENKDEIGLFPFDSLKSIRHAISQLGYGYSENLRGDITRRTIDHHWGLLKKSFLFEFDRPVPCVTNSAYTHNSESNYWKEFEETK